MRTDFRNMSDADWVRLREVNLDGIIRIARDAFPLMKASGRASLVNMASIMGHRGMRTLAAYGATKGAISALTRGLAVEYAPYNIRVNALAPGFIETALTERVLRIKAFSDALFEQTPLKRFGTGEDVALAALFFASDEVRLHHRCRARRRRRHGRGPVTGSDAGDGLGDELVDDALQRLLGRRALADQLLVAQHLAVGAGAAGRDLERVLGLLLAAEHGGILGNEIQQLVDQRRERHELALAEIEQPVAARRSAGRASGSPR